MYNGAGKWIVDVGIPAKSGVAGLVMCVVPGVCGFAVFSPRLDENGNSTRGVAVAAAMSESLGLHVLKQNGGGAKAAGDGAKAGGAVARGRMHSAQAKDALERGRMPSAQVQPLGISGIRRPALKSTPLDGEKKRVDVPSKDAVKELTSQDHTKW
jgi:hypothetical protein